MPVARSFALFGPPIESRPDAVMSGSFQADDQTYLRAALAELDDGFVGVTNLPEAATDQV